MKTERLLLLLCLSIIAQSALGSAAEASGPPRRPAPITKIEGEPSPTAEEIEIADRFFRSTSGRDFILSEHADFDPESIDQKLYFRFQRSMQQGCLSKTFLVAVRAENPSLGAQRTIVAFIGEKRGCEGWAYAVSLRFQPGKGWRISRLTTATL
ncbi:MAG: hypothetical protein Q8L23_16485 [Caulobacter sp.]|nr:hypothetical protein [Caulobacter sp.]